ncbi:hypothetical protein [Nitrosomonas sp.]|uniref:restriction endonuclease n=1 Tax=Nitrosomonas sp. TaxID=42353 RepID=UPI0035CCD360
MSGHTQNGHNSKVSTAGSGIDLVAALVEEDGFCAIQCKFYDENHRIQRSGVIKGI